MRPRVGRKASSEGATQGQKKQTVLRDGARRSAYWTEATRHSPAKPIGPQQGAILFIGAVKMKRRVHEKKTVHIPLV